MTLVNAATGKPLPQYRTRDLLVVGKFLYRFCDISIPREIWYDDRERHKMVTQL